MHLEGKHRTIAPIEKVWAALIDPKVLSACLPGCQRLEEVGDHRYAVTMNIGIGSITGQYQGHVQLSSLEPPNRMSMEVKAQGRLGHVNGRGDITLAEETGATMIMWKGDIEVGGLVASVGQRLFGVVTNQRVNGFFKSLSSNLESRSAV